MRSPIWWGATAALAFGLLSPAAARPGYLTAFKAHYNTTDGKPGLNAANCGLCHTGMPNQGTWNSYGEAFRVALGAKMVGDRAKVVAALVASEKKINPQTRQPYSVMIAADRMPAGSMAAPGGAGGGDATVATTGIWETAFNGVNMDGWTKMNQGNWVVENGILKYTGGGNGWLRSNKQYENYAMVVMWRFPQAGNNDAGVFLKAPMQGNPWPGGPQLNMGPGDNLGSIGGTQGTRSRADLIKPNDWNTYQVTVQNGMATLAINNQIAWEQATGLPTGPGYIGFQAENRPLDIAGIWIMPLR